MPSFRRLIAASTLLAGLSLAEVAHKSESKGLRIPSKSFTQFRLAGEGLQDDNLKADITQTQYEISIKGVDTQSSIGLQTSSKFDILLFSDQESDYNCYISASAVWLEHEEVVTCDFVTARPDSYQEQISEWSSADSVFLSKDKVHNDVFVVLDNTGWLQKVTKTLPNQIYHDVTYEMTITTTFAANDLYNKVFLGFMVTLGLLFATVVLMACLYRLQKKAHAQVMQTKKELKRINLQRSYDHDSQKRRGGKGDDDGSQATELLSD